MQLSSRLKQLRLAANLTQVELAKAIGLNNHVQVSSVELGLRHPSIGVLEGWLKATGARLEIIGPGDTEDPLRALAWEERQLLKAWRGLAAPQRSVGLALVLLLPRLAPEQLALLDHLRAGFEKSAPSPAQDVEPERQRASKRRGPRG